MNVKPRLVGAVLGATAALALGGVGFAWAQEAPTTTTPPATDAPADADGDRSHRGGPGKEGCDKDGDGVPDAGSTEAPIADETSV